MESLDVRRTHNDLWWYYSILHNYTRLDAIKFFELTCQDCHRGHALSIAVPRITTSAFKFAFAQRKNLSGMPFLFILPALTHYLTLRNFYLPISFSLQ